MKRHWVAVESFTFSEMPSIERDENDHSFLDHFELLNSISMKIGNGVILFFFAWLNLILRDLFFILLSFTKRVKIKENNNKISLESEYILFIKRSCYNNSSRSTRTPTRKSSCKIRLKMCSNRMKSISSHTNKCVFAPPFSIIIAKWWWKVEQNRRRKKKELSASI